MRCSEKQALPIRLGRRRCILVRMNDTAPTYSAAWIDRLIACLLAFFGVPLRFAARVLSGRAVVRTRFALLLEDCKHKGRALRLEGESDETVARRIAMMAWLAENPLAAAKHLARQARGWSAWGWMAFGAVPREIVGETGAPAPAHAPLPAPDSS